MEEKVESKPPEPKAEPPGFWAIVYDGALAKCQCGPYGIFEKHKAHRLAEGDYVPLRGEPQMTLTQAEALVQEQTRILTEFVRGKDGEILRGADGVAKTKDISTCPFRIVKVPAKEE